MGWGVYKQSKNGVFHRDSAYLEGIYWAMKKINWLLPGWFSNYTCTQRSYLRCRVKVSGAKLWTFASRKLKYMFTGEGVYEYRPNISHEKLFLSAKTSFEIYVFEMREHLQVWKLWNDVGWINE